ncbi:Patatin-like phospholipase domain-containing protein [Seminavis robusta]|uniref:Patatin-like phospholipase domain-containing protein n=1 Tax=Seminavis robusta TaxID=568900 RepID=A0A9N8H2E6_9STRA|nr:Patatin-like phospholipase domain-containing protein [Seminavis robusta]|eukprot:Sro63_g035910.1 Patatin-like phospholipase domain-containing protein (848) ;mRNA; f:84245-87179
MASFITLPEVEIPVPRMLLSILELGQEAVSTMSEWFHLSPELYEHLRANALLLFGVSIIFWPLLLSLITTFTVMGTWTFWLFTTSVFGLLQLFYVIYQFIMITLDIMGLSVLKTYTMLRNRLLNYVGKAGTFDKSRSRRLVWKERLEQATSYEDFLKIQIESQDPQHKKPERRKSDPAIMMRSSSFGNMEGLDSPKGMSRNKSYTSLMTAASEEEQHNNLHIDPEVCEELGEMSAVMLMTTKQRLKEARQTAVKHEDDFEAASTLKQLLQGVVKRNHLNVDQFLIKNARTVAYSGQYGLSAQSRKVVHAYFDEVEKGLDWIADAPIPEEPASPNNASIMEVDESSEGGGMMEFSVTKMKQRTAELNDRMNLVRKIKANVGRTSLMLSGGGAQAMYHLGVVRALIEADVYQGIKVISGTSGGSITAAMCALKTPEELHRDVCVPTISTDYMLTGEQAEKNFRWFPTLTDMGKYWLKTKLMVDSALFRRTCEFYFNDTTFEEAFERTGKHVCITVSASRSSDGAQRLLLNHISTPHVTLASAVAASCALPGVMAPAKLMAKNGSGVLQPFEVDGMEWIDGSVQADLPFQRISTLFNVSNYIVCQTNFHIVPLLNKAHHPGTQTFYWRMFQLLEWDVRNRALQLSRLGLFPKMFGHDVSKVFKQRYHGDLTLVPRFSVAQSFGLKTLSNPTVEDMEEYLKYGQIAAWPYLNVIRNMLRFERALDGCLTRLEERYRDLHPDIDWSAHDEIESIASASGSFPTSSITPSRVRFGGHVVQERKAEKLRTKVITLEQENQKLKQQLQQMEKLMAINGAKASMEREKDGEEKKTLDEGNVNELSEGAIWNLVRSS